jgi:prephenate dehydrogenase
VLEPSARRSQVTNAAIVGVGLIGGSLAAAWREANFVEHIVGVEPNADAAKFALDNGLVDEIRTTIAAETELIAVCTPSDQIAQSVMALKTHTAAIFDVGSVKSPIVDSLTQHLGGVPDRFVPCHPIAGSELSGPQAARADLFQGSTTVMTVTPTTEQQALDLVRAAWQATGTNVVELSAAVHDEMLAVTSHLPHLLAFAFMQQVDPEHLEYTGGGFRDFTRIANANPELWWRILSMNKEQVLAAANRFSENLEALKTSLADDDTQAGVRALTRAVQIRRDDKR